jgi:hypothetical protein
MEIEGDHWAMGMMLKPFPRHTHLLNFGLLPNVI